MNILQNLKFNITYKIDKIRHYFEVKKYKRKYPDYIEDCYNLYGLKHIWGITSWDNLTGSDANLYTMNDIDITYDRETKKYMLGIETAYMFKNHENECNYLKKLLEVFTKFMDDNNYSKEYDLCLFMGDTSINSTADSIEELYINFKIFVEGYCKVYEGVIYNVYSNTI